MKLAPSMLPQCSHGTHGAHGLTDGRALGRTGGRVKKKDIPGEKNTKKNLHHKKKNGKMKNEKLLNRADHARTHNTTYPSRKPKVFNLAVPIWSCMHMNNNHFDDINHFDSNLGPLNRLPPASVKMNENEMMWILTSPKRVL